MQNSVRLESFISLNLSLYNIPSTQARHYRLHIELLCAINSYR